MLGFVYLGCRYLSVKVLWFSCICHSLIPHLPLTVPYSSRDEFIILWTLNRQGKIFLRILNYTVSGIRYSLNYTVSIIGETLDITLKFLLTMEHAKNYEVPKSIWNFRVVSKYKKMIGSAFMNFFGKILYN